MTMAGMFAPEAPATVRRGSIGVLLLTCVDVLIELGWLKLISPSEIVLWSAFMRPGLRLLLGLAFAWGIARMLAVFYWGWLFVSVVVSPLFVIASLVRMASHPGGIGLGTFGPATIVSAALWLWTAWMLLTPTSLQAYRQHGRLWLK